MKRHLSRRRTRRAHGPLHPPPPTTLPPPSIVFEERPPAETLPTAAGVVVLFAVCLVAVFLLVCSMLAGAVDATVTMDNPERPPDWVCDDHADDEVSVFDEPKTIERDAGELVREAVHDRLWTAVVGPFVLWPVAATTFSEDQESGTDGLV